MARNKTLVSLLTEYRAKTRLSSNPAHNNQIRDTQIAHIQAIQEWLWEDFNWPHLRVKRDIPLQAGQRYYDVPEDLDIDRIERIEVRDGDLWRKLYAGIDSYAYRAYDSDLDARAWPVSRWQIAEDEQIEIHPIPDQNGDGDTFEGILRVTGIRKLNPLIADDDRADLDSRLIIAYCAAEKLAADGAKDAQLKLSQANKLYMKLRGGMVPRRHFKMFGESEPRFTLRGPPSIYYRVVNGG